MESQRSFIIIGLALVSFLLWQQWHKDYGTPAVQPAATQQAQLNADGIPGDSDSVSASQSDDVPVGQTAAPVEQATQSASTIHVTTDTLDLAIKLTGGDVVRADLVDFPVTQGSDEPYSILRSEGAVHIAQSGLIGANGPDRSADGRPQYKAPATEFTLTGDTLEVPLTWQGENGLTVTKTFVFNRGHHDVNVVYTVTNNTGKTAQVEQFAQLKQIMEAPKDKGGNMFMPTYRGAAFSTADVRYEKYTFDDIQDEKLKETTTGGWVAMLEHYFVTAWIPPQDATNKLISRNGSDTYAFIGYTSAPVSIANGDTATLSSTLYMGPKDQDKLAQLARGLDLTVDYGILWWISQPLFTLLKFLHSLVGNWGVAIILITVIVKGAMYPLTKKQYESMAKMRNLAPKMQQLKDRFGDDRQKMSQAMMELYRKEKVNPMGGCLPLLLQMPIFLALYWVLLESVELRHADFVLWITDLSVMDPYFVLPILTGASMYLLQRLQPTTISDPMQQKIMQWMPVAMSVFFLWFPAGLVLYWLVSNVITLIQAKIIYSSMEKRGIK